MRTATSEVRVWHVGREAAWTALTRREVISPESQARDRMEKFDVYTSIASVMEYVLVDSRKIWVHLHRRGPAGVWTEATYGPGQRFDLMTVELVLDMDTLYAGTGRLIGGPTPGI
jgi:hypothetical protein